MELQKFILACSYKSGFFLSGKYSLQTPQTERLLYTQTAIKVGLLVVSFRTQPDHPDTTTS